MIVYRLPPALLFMGLILWLFPVGCGRIGFERAETGTDSVTSSDTETATGNTPGTDTTAPTDADTGTGSNTDSSTVSDTATASSEDTDTASDSDSDSDSGSDSGADTGTATTTPCPTLPTGTELLSDTDAADFFAYGDITASFEPVVPAGETPFTESWHVVTGAYGDNATTAQMFHRIPSDVPGGDHLVVEFWARCITAVRGYCRTGVLVEQDGYPFINGGEYYAAVGTEWEFHQVPFMMPVDFAADDAVVTYRLGYADQTMELFPARMLNYGALDGEPRLDCLPDTTPLQTELNIISTAPDSATVDVLYEYYMEINGQPTPTLTVGALPDWLRFDANRHLFSGVPGYEDVGVSPQITVQAENANGVVNETFTITVSRHPNLLGHWKLDETDGTVASDASGNGRDGGVVGDVIWQPADGQLGGAFRCNGESGEMDYILLPSDPEMDAVQASSHTLSAWVRAESVPTGTQETANDFGYGILMKSAPNTGLWYDVDEMFHADYHFSGAFRRLNSDAFAPGTFHHVLAVLDMSRNQYTLLIDGIIDHFEFFDDADVPLDYGTGQWHICVANPSGTEYAWPANISVDDVRIYNVALSEHEIHSLSDMR